jgi:putative DNA primase/helicase
MAEPSGGFHLYGPSSSGKSTAIFAAGSMAGRGKRGANVYQWATTSNGLEAVAALNCDGCLAMDEIGQAQAGEAGEQIYRLCNETSKNRMTRDITMRKAMSWRIMVLSTGEVTLSQRMGEAGKKAMTGMEMRLVNVPSDGGAGHGLFESLHGFANGGELSEHLRNAAATYHGTPARAFPEHLVQRRRDQGDALYEDLKAKRAAFIQKYVPAGADGQVRYVGGRFAVVSIAGEMAIARAILPGEEGDAEAACVRCFKDWLGARGTTGSGEKQNGIRAVQHFLELHGSSRFAEIQTFTRDKAAPWQKSILKDVDEPREQLFDRAVSNMAGYKQWDKEHQRTVFMISQEVWKTEVCKGMDGDLVAKAIDEKGWLIRDGNHLAKLKRLPDQAKRVRLYHVTSDILAAEQDEEQAGEQQ